MTDTVDEYKRFDHFEKGVLSEPLIEITKHTTFNVTYEKIKKGRSIDRIVFHITKKQVADDISYKLDDSAYIDGKIRQEESEKILCMSHEKSIHKVVDGTFFVVIH